MKKLLVIALAPLLLNGCLAVAAGGAVDLVTESKQEKNNKELKQLKKEKKEREKAEREAKKN